MSRNAAQEKSQTPVITTFGSECLGLSGPLVAAEGDEQPRETRRKTCVEDQGEAIPEAVFCDGVANVPALADWLADHLDDAQLAELVRELAIVNNGHRSA
ncbi:MAG: hypothetical protein GY904_36775 [Planctomycetaceae bacterium]|nr:hypothetical protein [Planctomycetaceae bacterium]